jgi:hypothetical protein
LQAAGCWIHICISFRQAVLNQPIRCRHCGCQFERKRFGLPIHPLRLPGIEIVVLTFLHTVFMQQQMTVRFKATLSEAAAHAFERTAIKRKDRSAGARDADEVRHVAPHTCNARHFRHSGSIEPDSNVVGHLRGTGTPGTGINQRQTALREPHGDNPESIEDRSGTCTSLPPME